MKNKKLLAVFAIPLVIAVMVLPLCSFTTTQNDKGNYYQSHTRVDVGYTYYNNSGVSYWGTIPNILSCSLTNSSSVSTVQSSIKFTACNYVMASGHEIEYKSFGASRNPSQLLSYNLDNYSADIAFSLESDDPHRSFFNSVTLRNYTGENYSIELFDGSYTTLENSNTVSGIGVWGSGTLYYDENNNGAFVPLNYSYGIHYSNLYLSYKIDTLTLFDKIIEDLNIDPRGTVIFPNFVINFTVYTFDGSAQGERSDFRDLIGGIRVRGTLDMVSDSLSWLGAYSLLNDYYERGREEGFLDGEAAGLSNAAGVWGSFTDFLTTTVGGFLDFHLTPNITISSILSVILSITLVVLFLKLFAGG